MSVFFDKKYLPFLTLFLVVFISRLPFLFAGYGVEEDSWGIAFAAFHTKVTGVYEPSRFPGHPVQELIFSMLWGTGPAMYNGLCAFFSAVGTAFFGLILKELKFKQFFLASLAFAFVPVVYITSTYTIDFAWTEAFVLISLYLLLKKRFIASGIFLGLAIGCRITSGAMLLPFLIITWQQNNVIENFKRLAKIILPAAIIAFLFFLPLIMQFGTSFFMYYDQFPYPSIPKVLYKMTIGVLGLVGMSIMILMLTVIVSKKFVPQSEWSHENNILKKVIVASCTVILLYVISYFRLPQKSGYMIPVIPFMIILGAYFLRAKYFAVMCYSFMISSFVCSINLTDKIRGSQFSKHAFIFNVSGQELFFDPLSGPIFSDYTKRLLKIKYTEEVIGKLPDIHNKTVIIAGWWYNEIMVTLIGKEANESVVFEDYVNEDEMKKYISVGYEITYLPEQNVYNDLLYKIKTTDIIAKPFN
jgi:hypothetical protein